MVKKKATKPSAKKDSKKNPLFESTPKNFRIGNDIQPKRDLTRFLRWPKYILLQRQKRVLLNRLKVPPAITQFSNTLSKDQAESLFKLLAKYSPESRVEKKARLLETAQAKAEGKQTDDKKPVVLKYGLNHITTLVEQKAAKMVVIANDVDPIELVVWLPQLCRKMEVPFAIVKNQERLGRLVHQKKATCVALTGSRKEDSAEIDQFAKNFKTAFNESAKGVWGGGQLGIKSTHKKEALEKIKEMEELKKHGV